MLDLEQFVADCRTALGGPDRAAALREVLGRVADDPASAIGALGQPDQGRIATLHHAADLTVLNVIWTPGMTMGPHDHLMLAGIAVYGGREDNTFFRRTPAGTVEAAGGRTVQSGEVLLMGADTIHQVHNPSDRHTGAIHVYAGDFFNRVRTTWDADTGAVVSDPPGVESVFAEAEASWRAAAQPGGPGRGGSG